VHVAVSCVDNTSDREELKWMKKWAEMLQEGFLIGEKMHEKISVLCSDKPGMQRRHCTLWASALLIPALFCPHWYDGCTLHSEIAASRPELCCIAPQILTVISLLLHT